MTPTRFAALTALACLLLCVAPTIATGALRGAVRLAGVGAGGPTLNVWALEAPLSEEKFGNLLGDLDLFHAGVMVQDLTTNANTTWEFDADHFGHFFPKVDTGADGRFTFVSSNQAAVHAHPTNMTYWHKFKFMGTMTEAQYTQFATRFVPAFNSSRGRYYELFNLAVAGANQTQPSVRSTTCFDFQLAALAYMHGVGANLDVSELKQDVVSLYASAVHAVNMSSAAEVADMAAFFTLVNDIPDVAATNMTQLFEVVIPSIIAKSGSHAYLQAGPKYFAFEPASPFFEVQYVPRQLW